MPHDILKKKGCLLSPSVTNSMTCSMTLTNRRWNCITEDMFVYIFLADITKNLKDGDDCSTTYSLMSLSQVTARIVYSEPATTDLTPGTEG